MSDTPESADRQDVYELLPWFVAGTLPAADMARVRRAIAADPALAATLERIEEERLETILENESLPPLPADALDRLLARVETEAPRPDRSAAIGRSPFARLLAAIGGLAPRTVALAGAAAALVIVAEGGFLASQVLQQQGGAHYETASVNTPAGPTAVFLVQFDGTASMDAITTFLRGRNATIVDGPRAGGLYRISVAADAGPALLADLKANPQLVRFAASTAAPK